MRKIPEEQKRQTVGLRVDPVLWTQVKILAKKERRPISWVHDDLMKEALDARRAAGDKP